MNRRNFLQTSGTATTALMLSSLDVIASSNLPKSNMNNNFKLKLLATNWGFIGTLDEYCTKVKKEGYDGIEIWWPLEKKDQDELFVCLKRHELEVGFLCAGSDSNYQKHFDQFVKM
ncbi:MAG TPA: twin-arginine translocation signal domain-containing protein, partial [Puia sp.]